MTTDPNDPEIEANRNETPVVSAGRHLMVLEAVEQRVSSAGNSLLMWRFRIVGNRDPDADQAIFHNTSLLPQARWKLDQLLDALAAPLTGKIRVNSLRGRMMWGVVEHEEYEGTKRAKLVSTQPYIAAGVPPQATLPLAAPDVSF